jgi:hypothetical protein
MKTAVVLTLVILGLWCPAAFGQFPGGGPGGGEGGGRRFGGNPSQFFDRLANGKDRIVRAELTDPRMQAMFDRMAQRLNITNGVITREQFLSQMNQWRGRPPGGELPSGNPEGATGPGGANQVSAWAEAMFRQLDQNGDGVLNYDEMPEALRAEREQWDTDQNGLIDLNEFKAYFQARMQQFQAQRGPGWVLQSSDATPPAAEEAEPPRPVVYRAGKLPKELPAWFAPIDVDGDAQIGLYEWRASGRPIDEFLKIDRNNDGFLTVEEVLRFTAQIKGTAAAGSSHRP